MNILQKSFRDEFEIVNILAPQVFISFNQSVYISTNPMDQKNAAKQLGYSRTTILLLYSKVFPEINDQVSKNIYPDSKNQ